MSLDNLSEIKNYTPRYSDNQPQPLTIKRLTTEENLAPDKTSESGNKSPEQDQRLQQVDNTKSTDESDKSEILERLKSVNEQFPLKSTSLVFEFDDANEPPVIKVVDKESGDVIREIPPKELREIAKALSDIADNLSSEAGALQDKQASGILINEQL